MIFFYYQKKILTSIVERVAKKKEKDRIAPHEGRKCMNNQNKLLYDVVIKKLLSSNTEILKRYVKEILEEITQKEVENLKLIHPNIGINKNVVNSEVDLIYETEDTYYNIEVNRRYTKEIEKKNLAYLHQLSLRSIKKSKDYVKSKKVVQINLNNYDRFQKQEFVYKTKLIEENKYIQRNEEIEIYDVNLDYPRRVGYNYTKKNKLAKYLYLLVEEDEEKIKKIYEGDELLMDVKKEAERILENFDALLYYDPYELGMKDGRSEGIEIGRDEGRSEGINETAMNFIKEGVDLSIIAKATDIDMQKLQQMAMTMKA